MTRDDAEAYTAHWLESWNAHDIGAVLSHFAEHVRFSSPHARQLLPGSDGHIRGKDALRDYWEAGLRRVPDLRFDLLGVYVGIDTLVINYRNQRGGLASEVLTFEGPLVVQGHGTYLEHEPYHLSEDAP